MSLKAIELQVAIPRTQDAGKLQEQLQQKSQIGHDLAAREMQKKRRNRKRPLRKTHGKTNYYLRMRKRSGRENPHRRTEKKKKGKKGTCMPEGTLTKGQQ